MKKAHIVGIITVLIILAILPIILFLLAQQPRKETPKYGGGTITTLKNSTGTEEINIFLISDSVYAKGSGMRINQNYTIIIINDTTIVDDLSIPTNITTTVTVTTDKNGAFQPTLIWPAPLTPGNYDIIADCQKLGEQGVYDYPDAIDDIEVNTTAGFFVIPEIPLGTLAVLIACLAAMALNKKSGSRRCLKNVILTAYTALRRKN